MRKKYFVRLWLVVLVTFIALNLISFLYVSAFYRSRGNDYYLSSNELNASDLQSRVLAYNDLIKLPNNESDVETYYLDFKALNEFYFDDIYYFNSLNPNMTSDGHLINSLLVASFNKQGISIEKESIIYGNSTNEKSIIYFKVKALDHIFVATKELEYFILDSNAIIFKEDGHLLYPYETYGSQFYTLLENGNTITYANEFKERLNSEESFITTGRIQSKRMTIVTSIFSQEDFTNKFYIGEFISQYAFVKKYLPLLYLTIAETIVFSAIVFFVVIYAVYSLKQSQEDYISDLGKIRDENIFYLLFNKKGRLTKSNGTFKTKVRQSKNYRNISDFVDDRDMPLSVEALDKGSLLNLKLNTLENKSFILRATVLKQVNNYALFGEDVSRQFKNLDRIESLAFAHPITNLANIHRLEDEIIAYNNTDAVLTLIAFDVQNFRYINQMFGRNNGDAILNEIATRLKDNFKNLFHIEGDLFVGLISKKLNHDEIEDVFKRLEKSFQVPLQLGESKFEAEFRLGVYFKEEEKDFKRIYESLMQALKTAKENATQKYVIYDINIGQKITREIVLQHQIQKAIDNNEFKLYFQPQLDVSTNKIVGFESLLRWENPYYDGESPQYLIELAEKNNMIIQIGKFVLREAFKYAKKLEGTDIKISVNVSLLQIFQTGFVSEVSALLKEFGVSKNKIILELTETAIIESYNQVVDKLAALRKNGFIIHLDDFGEGYSSFTYLKTLPSDGLKISYSFTKDIIVDKSAASIVKEMIILARNFEKEIICEGIETEAHAKMVARFGCNVVQGYWISRAVPFDGVIELIEKYNGIKIK